ncbi:Protein CHUP1, chloroplastic [Morella rubra]|uniref:Protein CHUP1, chloroplastic n=1 Tax=Morella rubra TaxID=262757 RepID=A0A6A1WKB7_9ROSI|nr:Protein CHUP1, chloroplastic [Morella rubra]
MSQEDDESEINLLKKELAVSAARIDSLEKENQELKQEVSRLKAQISSLRAYNNERKTMLWKKLQNSLDSNSTDGSQHKPSTFINRSEQSPEVAKSCSGADFPKSTAEKPEKVSNPPPRPISVTPSLPKEVEGRKTPPVPLPPPLPSKSLVGIRAVRRVPEVIELYRSLTRRDAHKENRTNTTGTPLVASTKNMIGEIENRSSYLSAIKSDVERRGEFIRLEQRIDNVERMRESTSKRYRDLQIPWKWLLDTGLVGQMKLSSLKLAKDYMKRITKELQNTESSCDENLVLQGVRFAYRVHQEIQFAGGFDAETIQAFEKLKRVGLGSDK